MKLTAISNLAQEIYNKGLITTEQWEKVNELQSTRGGNLLDIAIARGFVTERAILKYLGKKYGLSVVSLSNYVLNPETVKRLPAVYAKKLGVIPLFEIEGKVVVATSDPLNLSAMDEIRSIIKKPVDPVLALESEIIQAIQTHYQVATLGDESAGGDVSIVEYEKDRVHLDINAVKLEQEAAGSHVVTMLNNIFYRAYADGASDIHIEPNREGLRIRIRVDGVLQDVETMPKTFQQPIVSRVKIISGIDVAEHRVPQDGRVRIQVQNHPIDIRVNTYPTLYGEAAAIRLLGYDELLSLEKLGFSDQDYHKFERIIQRPHGIFLVTGPTGSGKTTTLYSALQRINSGDKHILSIEDPVEREIEGVDQTQVNIKAGMTFAAAIRAMLRQDPDIIMVGEIRDFETADIAIRAAMTGHLVFSTLHTNTAISAITRLIDLGVQPFLIASTLLGVMSQRLVRRVCRECGQKTPLVPAQKLYLGDAGTDVINLRAVGCEKCRHSGYHGRTGIFEIFEIDDGLKRLIHAKASEVDIQNYLKSIDAYQPLMDDAVNKMRSGVTNVEEIMRVIQDV